MAAVQTPGLNPSVLVAPDYQTQMAQVERQRALAQVLRQQALTDTPGNGGTVSWSQGLARIADALASNISNKRADKKQLEANQAYAAGMARMFGLQSPSGAPAASQASPVAQTPQNAPQQAPAQPQAQFVPGQPPAAGQADPLAPLPDAPPQAAQPQPPSAAPAQTGGAPAYPFKLSGNPQQDFSDYIANSDEFTKQMIAAHAKAAAPTDIEVLMQHAGIDPGSALGRQIIQQNIAKTNYIAPVSGRPGGWTIYPDGHKEFNPQAPAPGAMPVIGPDGNPTGAWTEDPSASNIQAHQAGAVAGAQASAKAPFETVQTFNPNTGQMEIRPKSDVTGGGSLNAIYGRGGHGAAGHAMPAGPSLGQQAGFEQYAKHSADAFDQTQRIADSSPQRVQSLREMQDLVAHGLPTGPTSAKMQQLAEEHGLTFLAKDNAFVFNKDAARFVAQSAADLGLNGSDARLGMMANASPNMKMTPQALKTVIPTMIGLEYAKMAKATAAASYAQRNPGGNAQFETQWRQAYDPRMFTEWAKGGPSALAKAPAAQRQAWLKDYRQLKAIGVDFTAFAQ